MIKTNAGRSVHEELLHNYFKSLVNSFFKILPMRENGESSLPKYLNSLQSELLGCGAFIPELSEDPQLLTLCSILQFLSDHPECNLYTVRREVFKAISICNRLKSQYSEVNANASMERI